MSYPIPTVTSTLQGAGTLSSSDPGWPYTADTYVPDGHVWILKCVTVSLPYNLVDDTGWQLFYNGGYSTLAGNAFSGGALGNGIPMMLWHVMNPGDRFNIGVYGVDSYTWMVSGTQLIQA